MANKHRKGLIMLKQLLKELYDKVVLVTTMWPETEDNAEENYASREEELKSDDWDVMITGGSVTWRFRNTQESAWSIIERIFNKFPTPRSGERKAVKLREIRLNHWRMGS